ncbi:MAG: M48 family metallopeptidase [Bacteroidales bacterium]|nr:M48 family metallopeptidase [Bacteroidales bacterium]
MKCYHDDAEFGRISIVLRKGMRNVRFRWKNGRLHASAPVGITAERFIQAVDNCREGIRKAPRREVTFYPGQVIPCFNTTLTITGDPSLHTTFAAGIDPADKKSLYLHLPSNFDFDAHSDVISRIITDLLGRVAHRYLIPLAEAEAQRLGLQPKRFEIGRGMKKLGHCTRSGVIQLSRHLMLMPEPLVRCVVCHELAHLTHFDHSPAFHTLLNQYLGGQEKQLEQQIENFPWPIQR